MWKGTGTGRRKKSRTAIAAGATVPEAMAMIGDDGTTDLPHRVHAIAHAAKTSGAIGVGQGCGVIAAGLGHVSSARKPSSAKRLPSARRLLSAKTIKNARRPVGPEAGQGYEPTGAREAAPEPA
jgi:hypothetical protein